MEPKTTLGIILGFVAEIFGSLLITFLIFKITIRRARDLGLTNRKMVLRAFLWAVIIILSINFLTRVILVGSLINFLYSSALYILCLGFWFIIESKKIKKHNNIEIGNYVNNDLEKH